MNAENVFGICFGIGAVGAGKQRSVCVRRFVFSTYFIELVSVKTQTLRVEKEMNKQLWLHLQNTHIQTQNIQLDDRISIGNSFARFV